MDRIDYVSQDMPQKWMMVRHWLEPLAAFASGKYLEDREDEYGTFSGKYLERPFRVRISVDSGTHRLEAKVNNQRGSLRVRLARSPLDPLPEHDPNWSDEPPKARHFLSEHIYIEDEQAEVARQVAMLGGLVPNLVAQLFYSYGADDFDLGDEAVEVMFYNDVCVAPHQLPAQIQGALDLVQQIARELGA